MDNKTEYILEIETLNVVETYTAVSVRETHQVLTEKLHELYIPYDKKQFISLRTMYRQMQATKLNDFYIYKCENSIIKLYKMEVKQNTNFSTTQNIA